METSQFLLAELEALDKKIEKAERALTHLSKQLRESTYRLSELNKKRECLSGQYKQSLSLVPNEVVKE